VDGLGDRGRFTVTRIVQHGYDSRNNKVMEISSRHTAGDTTRCEN